MKLAIIGATGLVGRTIIKVLEEKDFKVEELIPVASEKSVGSKIIFKDKEHEVVDIETALFKKPNIVIFSAGKDISLKWATEFAKSGTFVIDNSSAWRMDSTIKLVVPEVNIALLEPKDKIIANPNCSTIQLVVVLWPLHKRYRLKRIVVSTYQSVTGSGFKGINQLMSERDGKHSLLPAYPHNIDLNCIPHGGAFLENDYTEEEMKLTNESRKILGLPDLKLTSTVVRVPVIGGHSESVNIEFEKTPDINEIKELLGNSMGIIVTDNVSKNEYPMPITSKDRNEVFVGRIRIDNSNDKAINLWIAADNLRKGAATNAVQIAEYIYDNFI
jgi:aspartate-semialdehyde dehydrogenase